MIKVRKTTINLVCGILIGMFISGVSDSVSDPHIPKTKAPPLSATTVSIPKAEQSRELGQIAMGLQIIEMPHPLSLNGLHPYQTYINGKPVAIPYAVVGKLLKDHDHLIAKDKNVNLHNMNLKRID